MTGRRTVGMAALGTIAVSLLSLLGCGYALVGRSSTLPEDVRTIYVEALQNQTRRAQLEQVLARAIADEFVTRRRFEVVRTPGEADAVLSGSVSSFAVRPVSFGTAGRAREYEITIGARMQFKRTANEDVLWHRDNYTFRELYEADVSEADFFSRQDEAIEEVAQKFAQTMVIDLLEGF